MNDESDQIWSRTVNLDLSTEDDESQRETPLNAKRIVNILSILDTRHEKYLIDQNWANTKAKQKKKINNIDLVSKGIGITQIGKSLGENEGNDYPVKEYQIQPLLIRMQKVKMINFYEEKSHKYYFITDTGKKAMEKIKNEKNGILGIVWNILLK